MYCSDVPVLSLPLQIAAAQSALLGRRHMLAIPLCYRRHKPAYSDGFHRSRRRRRRAPRRHRTGRGGASLVIAKDSLRESSSEYAQGGIAVALSDDDEVELHEQDTIVAGDGLCDAAAVHTLVEEAPAAIEQLIDWGTAFDREGAKLLFAREGAHSRNRVLHAQGDSTGREIARTLRQSAASLENVAFQSYAAITDLLLHDGEVAGMLALDETARNRRCCAGARRSARHRRSGPCISKTPPIRMSPPATALLWLTAPAPTISDIEFVQFHPDGFVCARVRRAFS